MIKDTLLRVNLSVCLLRTSPPVLVLISSCDCYFHYLDASLKSVFYIFILSSCNYYLRRSDLYLKTVSHTVVIKNFEQVLKIEFFYFKSLIERSLSPLLFVLRMKLLVFKTRFIESTV
jgi:hypothetical protein